MTCIYGLWRGAEVLDLDGNGTWRSDWSVTGTARGRTEEIEERR